MIEYELYEKLSDDDICKYICEIFKVDNVFKILECDNKNRDVKLEHLKKCFPNNPISQLSRVIGINRKIIERANVQKETSPLDIAQNNVQKETSPLDKGGNNGKK